jgi:hypothetical protein
MESVTINILSKEEIKALRKSDISITKNLASHMNKCNRIASALNAEMKAVKDNLKEKHGEIDNAIVTIENRPEHYFSKEEFIAVYGEEEYNRFYLLRDKFYVTFH